MICGPEHKPELAPTSKDEEKPKRYLIERFVCSWLMVGFILLVLVMSRIVAPIDPDCVGIAVPNLIGCAGWEGILVVQPGQWPKFYPIDEKPLVCLPASRSV